MSGDLNILIGVFDQYYFRVYENNSNDTKIYYFVDDYNNCLDSCMGVLNSKANIYYN